MRRWARCKLSVVVGDVDRGWRYSLSRSRVKIAGCNRGLRPSLIREVVG